MMERLIVLLLVLAVVSVKAGPLNVPKSTCITTCPPSASSSKFNFEQGKMYSFDYVTDTRTHLSNDPKQTTGFRVKARVNFEMASQCEMIMHVEDALLEELRPSDGLIIRSPNTQRFQAALVSNDLHFAFIDGKVSHVCAPHAEPTWVLNVKRGLISMIQNTMPSLTNDHSGNERDVTGDCKVRYTTSATESNSVLVKREKDLLTCTGRQNHRSSIQSMPYFVRSDTQSMPFTLSSHSCQQTIKGGRFMKIECAEMHRLRSFSRGQGGARTTVSQTLTFVKETSAPRRSHTHIKHRRTSLRFDFARKDSRTGYEVREIMAVLADICARYREDVRPHSPRLFTELVYHLRRLNEPELRKVFAIVDRRKACRRNNDFVRRMFLDAIPMLGNAHSMGIMKDMIVGKKVSNLEANLWLTSLAFVQKPTQKMLAFLRPLLDEKQPRKQAVLGLSAMVHQFCQGRSECHTEPEVLAIGRALRRFLHGDCSSISPEQENRILIALKAIGNAGVLSFVSNDLVRCAQREENSMAVRVAAVEAFRRMDCSVDRKPLMSIYKDIKIDSELRINAYLSLMVCPSEEVIEAVKNQLAAEKVNHVGSFVWTHLTNLAETADPREKGLKDIIEDISLKREFKKDKLMMSRNIEKSAFFKSVNAGGRLDSNFIGSPKSFLPRSVSLNLTSFLFGQSYNFFEVSGRVEGLETLLEHYFGPDGYFRSSKSSKASKETALNAKDFKYMDSKFKLQNDRLRGSLAFKIFGHEVGFFELLEESSAGRDGINFLEILIKLASQQEMEWSKNFMFLDSTITIPTITGLPLELSINGTASLALKARGKLDIRRLVSWPTTFDIDGSLEPSGSVEISAMMGVDAFYSRYGMKMVSNVHSSTQLDAKLKAKNSETFDVDFRMPRDKQEVINFNTKFFMVHRNDERESAGSGQRIDRKLCTGRTLARLLGAELCASVKAPKVSSFRDTFFAPIASPFSASIALHKRDTHSSYRLSARWLRKKHRLPTGTVYSRSVRFEVDTPNSRHSRRHLLNFELDIPKRAIRLHLESPQRKIGFTGAFTNQANHKQLQLKFFKDDSYFNVNLDAKMKRRGQNVVFTPTIKVIIPGLPSIRLLSNFYRTPSSAKFSVELTNLLRSPVKFAGGVDRLYSSKEVTYSSRISFESHFFRGSYFGKVHKQRGRSCNWVVKVGYANGFRQKPHIALFMGSANRVVSGRIDALSFTFQNRLSQFPKYRSVAKLNFKRHATSLEVKTNIMYGAKLQQKIFSLVKFSATKNNMKGINFYSSASFIYPQFGINSFGKLTVSTTPSGGSVNLIVKERPSVNTLKLNYNIQLLRTEGLRVKSDLQASVRRLIKLTWNMDLRQTADRSYRLTTNGNMNGYVVNVVSVYNSPAEQQHTLISTIKLGGTDVVIVDLNTDLDPMNPKLILKVKRNNKSYSVSGSYSLKTEEETQFGLDYQAEVVYPSRTVRTFGSVKREETNVNGKLVTEWDVGRDESKVMTIEGSFVKEEKNGKRTTQLELSVLHPVRNGHLQVGWEREDYKGSVHMELQYAPKKRFSIDSMFEIDDGWTQKGLMASLTVKTPFKRFESTHLGINLFGQLRYRKAEITILYDTNKRIVTTLIIKPQGGTNFLATLKIITPFPRYSFLKFHLKNVVTGTQIQSELISEFGIKKTRIQVVGVNNGDYYANDLALAVSMTSPFANFRDLTLTLDYKDDSSQYSSNMEFKWAKDKKVTAMTNFNFVRNGFDITSSGEMRFTTPIKEFRKGGLNWQHQNTKSMVKSEVSVEFKPDKRISATLNGLVTRPEAGALRFVGRSMISSPGGQISAKLSHHHTKNSLDLLTSLELPSARLYELTVSGKKNAKRVDGALNINTPHDGYRKIGASFDLANDERMKIFESEVYAGNTKVPIALLRSKLTLPSATDPTLLFNANFKSNIVRYIEMTATHQHTLTKSSFKSMSEVKLSGRTVTLTNEVGFGKAKKFKTMVATSFKVLRSFTFGFEHEGTAAKFSHMHFLTYNTNFELQSRINYNGINNLIAESKLNFRGLHSLRVSNQKSGPAYETSVVATVGTSKTIDFSSRVTPNPKLTAEVKLSTPFRFVRSVSARVEARQSGLKSAAAPKAEFIAAVSYTFDDKVINVNGLMNMNSLDDLLVTMGVNTPFENARDMSLVLRHNKRGKEYTTSFTGKTENGRVEISNIFQKQGTLKNKLNVKTPFSAFKSATLDFEHRGKFPKLSHKHRINFDVAGVKMNLDNKFDIFNLRLIEVQTSFRSNIRNAQKAGFRFTFDKPISGIETGLLIEWPTDKLEGRIAFKANPEKKIQLKISTPFYYFKELQGLYTLGNRGIKNFNHQIILAFKNDVLTIGLENSLTIRTLNYIDAKLKINTPLSQLKSLSASYQHQLLKRSKKVEVNGEYNGKKYLLKGSYSDMPIHVVEMTLETPHTNFKSITSRHELAVKDSLNWKCSSELFNAELKDRLSSTIESKAEPGKYEGSYKLNRNGKIITDVRYQVSWEDKKRYAGTLTVMNNMLPKNPKMGQMILLEGSVDIRKAISVRATLRTPFKKAENQWVSVKFERSEFLKADTMKTGNLIVEAGLLKKVAMMRVSYSYGKRPSFSVNLKLPDRQEMKLEGSLVISDTNSFFKMSLTMPDNLPKPWNLMVDVTTTKTIGVVFKLDTTIKKYETITARATITRHAKYLKVGGRLTMPVIPKPIEFDIEGDRSRGLRVSVAMRGPIVRYFRTSLDVTGNIKNFDIKGEVYSVHLTSPILSTLSFNAANGFKIEGTLKTPLKYVKSLGFEAAVIKSDKRGYVEISHYRLSKPIRAEGKVDYSKSKLDGTFILKTPFKKVEDSRMTLTFEKVGSKVVGKFDLMNSALKAPMSGNVHFDYTKPKVQLSGKLSTPFEAVKETSVSMEMLLQRDVNGKIVITHNKLPDRIHGRINVQFPKTMEVELSTPFNGWYKHVIVSTVFTKGTPFTAGATIKYFPANVISAKFQGEVALPKIFLNYNIATPFEMLRQTYGTVKIVARKNFKLEATAFHNKLKEKITLTVRADDADTKTLRIQFNSPLNGPLKDVGIKLFIARKADAFSFVKALSIPRIFSIGASINYHQGKEIDFVTSVNAPSWKKFDAKVKLNTPFEFAKKTGVKVEFDIVKNFLAALRLEHNKMKEAIATRLFIDFTSMKLFYSLSTPFNGPHKKITLDGFAKKNGELYNYEVILQYYNGKKVSVTGDTKLKKTDFYITFKLNTPFKVVKEVTGKLTFNPKSRPMITYEVSHMKWPRKIEGTVHATLFSRLRATLKTPFKGAFKDALLDYSFKTVGKAKVGTLLLKYSPDREYKAVVSHEKEKKSVGTSLLVETPFEMMKKLKAEVKASWKDKVIATAELSHNKLKESIHGELSFEKKFGKKRDLLLQLSVTTPFEKVKSIEYKLSYFMRKEMHSTSMTFIYNKVKTYEFHGYLKNAKDNKEVTLGMQTPHKGIWKAMTFNAAYEKVGQKYNVHSKFIYLGAKTIELNGVVSTNPKDLIVEMSLKTPYKVMEKTDGKFTFKLLDARIIRTSSNFKFVSSLSFAHSKVLNGRKVVANAKGTVKPDEKSMEVDFQMKDQTYKAEVHYQKKKGNKYSVGASAVTDEPTRPWFVLADITLNSAKDFSVEAKVTCPEHRLKPGGPGAFNIKLNHKGDLKAFENAFQVTAPYHDTIMYKGKVAAGPVAEFHLEGPLATVKKVTVKHSGGWKKFVSSGEVAFKNGKKIDLEAEGAVTSLSYSFQGSVKTPFSKWEENSLKIDAVSNVFKTSSTFMKALLLMKSSYLGELEASSDVKRSSNSYTAIYFLRNNLKRFVAKEQTYKSTLKVTGMKREESTATLLLESSQWKENVDLLLKWKKTSDMFMAEGKINAIKDYLKNEFLIEIPKMKPEESNAVLTISSKSLKEPVTAKITWKKTSSSFEGSMESKAPVKFMKSKISVKIPKMKAEESDATLEMTSTDLKEPARLTVKWEKKSASFSGRITASSQLDKSEISVKVDPMSKKEATATAALKSSNLKGEMSVKLGYKVYDKELKIFSYLRTPYEKVKDVIFEFAGVKTSSKIFSGSLRSSANALGSIVSKISSEKNGNKEFDVVILSALKSRRVRRSLNKVFAMNMQSMKTEHKITIEVPKAKAVKRMSLTVTKKEKQLRAVATWDSNSITVDLKRPKKYTVTGEIITPFKGYEKMSGEVSASEKCCANGHYSFKVVVPKGRTSFSLIWMKGAAGLGVSSIFKNTLIPKVPDMSLAIVHKGEVKKFECSADLRYGKKEINGKLTFNIVDKKAVTLVVKTPFKKFEETSVTATFTGDKKKFNLLGSLKSSFGGGSLKINSANEGKPTDRQTGNAELKINKKTYSAKYHFEGNLKSFVGSFDMQSASSRVRREADKPWISMRVTSKLQLSSYIGTVKMSSKFLPDPYKSLKMDINANGDFKKFKKFNLKTSGTANAEVFMTALTWDLSSKSAGLEMRVPSLKKGCKFSTENSFLLGSELKIISKMQHCSDKLLDFSVTSDLKRKFTAILKTPYTPANTEITYQHSKVVKGFSGQATIVNNKLGKYAGEIIVSWATGIFGELKVQTPKSKNFEVMIRQRGVAKKSVVMFKLTLPKTTIQSELSYDVKMPITIALTLETSFEVMRRTHLVFSHVQEPKRFKTSVQLEHSKIGTYGSSLSFDSSRSAFITFTLKTPHPQVKDLKIDFSFLGKLREQFSQGLSGTLNGKVLGYIANINVKQLLYRIVITTPFKGFEKIIIGNEHKGDIKKFEHAMNVEYGGKKIRMDMSHNWKDSAYHGKLRFTSHFDKLKDISLTVKGEKVGSKSWKMEHSLKYAPTKVIRSRGSLSAELPLLQALLQIETPFERFKKMELIFKHTHNAHTDFNFFHTLKVNDKAGSMHGSLKKIGDKTVGFMMIETPFPKFTHFDINFDHIGSARKFQNEATISWQPGTNQLRATTKFDISTPQTLIGSIVLNTPWSVLRSSRLEIKHAGPLRKHKQRVMFEHNGRTLEYLGMTNLLNWRDMATEHVFRSSFLKVKSAKVTFDHKNGVAHLNVFWNKMNTIKVVGLLNTKNMILAELSVSTALYNRKSGTIRLKHFNEADEAITQGALDFNGLKTDVEFALNKKTPGVRITTSLPHSATYDFRVAMRKVKNDFVGGVRVAKNKKEVMVGETKVKYDFVSAAKSLEFSAEGFVMANGKKDLKIELTFKGNKKAASTVLKVTALTHKVQSVLTYHGYSRVMGSLKYNDKTYSLAWIYGDSADMKDGKNLAINVAVGKLAGGLSIDFSANELEIDLKTPFAEVKELFMKIYHKQKNRIDFDHRSFFRLNKHRYFNLDVSVDTANRLITLRSPQKITIKYSLAGTRFVRCVLELDLDKTDSTKKVNMEVYMQLKGNLFSDKFSTEGLLTIKSKARKFVIETKTAVSPASFSHKTTVRPKDGTTSPWEISLSTLRHVTGRDRERTDEWIVTTPVRQVKVFMETSIGRTFFKNDLDFFWDNKRVPSKKMGWKLKMMNRNTEYRSIMLFHHPVMKEGVKLETQSFLNTGNTLMRSKVTFRYTDNIRDAMIMSLKISREGPTSFRGTCSISQESTQLYTKVSGSFGGNRGIYINGLSLEHKMDGKVKTFQISTHLNVLKRSLMMELVTPIRTYSFISIATLTSSDATFTYQLSYDRSKKLSGNLVISKSPSFKVRVFYSPGNADNYIEAYGKFITQKHLEFQVHRMVSNRRYADFLFFLKLRGEHLLKSRLFWRPTALSEAKMFVQTRVKEIADSAKALWPKFVNAITKEVTMKKNLVIATIPNFENMRKYSRQEMERVNDDLLKLAGMAYDMYMGNEFYMRQIINALVKMALKARAKGKAAAVSFQRHYVTVWSPRMRKLMNRPVVRLYVRLMRAWMIQMARRAKAQANFANDFGRRHIYRTVEMIRPVIASLDSKYAELERRGLAAAQQAMKTVHYHYSTRVHPHVVRAKTWVGDSLKAVSNYHRNSKTSLLDHFHEGLRARLGVMHQKIQKNIDLLAHKYGVVFKMLRSRLNRTISQSHLDRVAFASNFIKSAIRYVQKAYDHYDVEKKLKDFTHTQYLQALDYIRENSIDVIKEYLRLDQNKFTVFEPQKGRIEGQIYVPFRMKDLRSRPDASNLRRPLRKMYRTYKRILPRRRPAVPGFADLKRAVMRYIPNYETNPRAWLPAIRGYASVAGNHLITFDKVHFDLDGNCDYVLARDYKAKRWTVLLNQAEGKRYISFRAYGKVFGIHNDHSVTVDGMKVELPFMLRNLTIHRFGPIIKAKDQMLGFSVTSDVVNDVHTIGVTKWYHGKLGGLFGNFDDEQFNDMQTVEHELTSDVNAFIQSWAIRDCKHHNKEQQEKKMGPIVTEICKFFFGCPLSSMSKCFRHVDPKPYLKMCVKDVAADPRSPKSRICRAAQAYVTVCRKAHVTVNLPLLCRKCRTPDNSEIREEKTVIMDNNKATADVVFVVEEAPCNKDLTPKLNEVVQRLELAFRRRGMTDIQYGMVGFGRKVHGFRRPTAHSHTIDSKLMGSAKNFARALRNFNVDLDGMNASKRTDTLGAILTASRYPLRPGAAKHIVVVPCAACEERRTNLDDAEDALKEQDIILHVLIEQQIRMRRPDLHPKSNYLFGVDRHSVYTQKDVQKLSGDRRLLGRVLRPLDICSQLAYATNGAVFNSGKLTRMHVVSQAWFAEVFAQRLAAVSHSPRKVECTCVPGRWRPQLMCRKNGLSTVPMVPREVEARPLALPTRLSAQPKLQYRR